VVVPDGPLPVSRGALERRLERVNRYDRRAEVTAYRPLTPTGTVTISFKVVDVEPFQFAPGHFIGIRAELPEWGVRVSPYCIMSPPRQDRTFELIVRLVPEGPLSYYLASLRPGDVISFRGPLGRSMVPKEDDTDLVLLATGVGIGPILSLARHLLGQGFSRRLQFFWGLRQEEDVCLQDQLDALTRAHRNFSYDISLSRPSPRWVGHRGRLTDTVPGLIDEVDGKHFYLVGNGAMIEEIRAALSELGVSRKLIYEERYFNIKHKADPVTVARIREGLVARNLDSPLVVMANIDATVARWREGRGLGSH
jgi:NAD(P)H-flavin reductase